MLRCVAHLSRICAGVLECDSEIFLIVGCSSRSGVSLACFMSSSRKDCGPKDEYAVTVIPSPCASLMSPGWVRYG